MEEESHESKNDFYLTDDTNQTATLIVDTRPNFPGASIIFDGDFIGETIRRIPDVSLGEHQVAIKHPYIGKVISKINVNRPGKKLIINFNSTGEAEIK
jgi:hypothetical protein